MGERYFERLYGWLEAENGYAIVSEMLHTLAVPPEFGLIWVKGRAPSTSSTDRAIEASRSPVEVAIQDAVDAGTPGFRDGWISTLMLRQHLESRRHLNDVPRSEWGSMLAGLGYVLHPALKATHGQVHNTVLPDGGRPKLYVHKDHPSAQLQRPAAVAKAYSEAQFSNFVPLPLEG